MTNTLHNKIITKYSTIKPYPTWVIVSLLGLGFVSLASIASLAMVLIALFIWDISELNSWYENANIIEMSMYEIVGFALICGVVSYLLLRYLLQNDVVKYRFALISGILISLVVGGWFLAFLVEVTALPADNFESLRTFIHSNHYRKSRVNWLLTQSNTVGIYTGKVSTIKRTGKNQFIQLEILQSDASLVTFQAKPTQLTQIDVGDVVIIKAKQTGENLVISNIKRTVLRGQARM